MPNDNESSGAHPIPPASPAAQPAPSLRTDGATITFNPKTMLTLAAFALFGAGGGAGGSQLLGSGVQKDVAALTDKVDRLDGKVDSMDNSVETVAVSVVELKADLKAERRDDERLEEEVEKLKERVRKLELRRR